MNREETFPPPPHTNPPTATWERFLHPTVGWGAVIAGTVTAIAIHLLLTAFGVGIGLAVFSPVTNSDPVGSFSFGAALVWSVCALIALWCGGMLAGRFSRSVEGGFIHGLLVWSMSLITTIVLLSFGTGMVMGGAFNVIGKGLGAGGSAIASGVEQVVEVGLERGADQLESFIDEAIQTAETGEITAAEMTRARREIGFAVTRLFTGDNEVTSQENQQAVVQALTEYTGMSQAEANERVNDWVQSYNELKAELANLRDQAELKARELADEASSQAAKVAMWTFFALLIGLAVTAYAGVAGAKCGCKRNDTSYTTTTPARP